MVNSTNIFWYLLEKMSSLQQNNEKKVILSQLKKILDEHSNFQDGIVSDNNAIIRECMGKIQEQILMLRTNYLSTGSDVLPSIHVDPSFLTHLSRVKLELERLSEQISILNELRQKIEKDDPNLFESEQKMIKILLCKFFLESQEIQHVRNMIELCRTMDNSLTLLENYSDKIFRKMKSDIMKMELNLKEFDIDQNRMRNNKQSLDKILREISGLHDKLIEIRSSFLKNYSTGTLLLGSEELLLLVESIKNIQKNLKEKKNELDQIRQSVITFVELELSFRFNFVKDVECDDYDSASPALNDSDHFYRFYKEPAGNLRVKLEESLEIMKQ